MKTTVRNRDDLSYVLSWAGVNSKGNYSMDKQLVRSSFYDFAARHEVAVMGFSNAKNDEFVDALLKSLIE